MKSNKLVMAALLVAASGAASAADSSTVAAAQKIRALSNQVQSFQANLKVIDDTDGKAEASTSSITASRTLGWKIKGNGDDGPYEIVSDYKKMSTYVPKENKVYEMSAERPEAIGMLRKVITDLNPLELMSQDSMKLVGQETLAGESVLHFTGTTVTAAMQNVPPVKRNLEAWVSPKDGLPRKTVETVGQSSGSTIYSDVRVGIPVEAATFQFTPPQGVQVVDVNAQIKRMEQQPSTPEKQP
jgi:outer membrane lipoprotein-sorting protein